MRTQRTSPRTEAPSRWPTYTEHAARHDRQNRNPGSWAMAADLRIYIEEKMQDELT
jgi:hypothetical protein